MASPVLSKLQSGIVLSEVLIATASCLIVVFIAFTLEHKLHHTTSNTGDTTSSSTTSKSSGNTNEYAVLSPATVPSKAPECSQQLTFSSGGNSGPITCANGDLNVLEWNSVSTLEPKVLTLGYDATASQVQSVVCADVEANVSNPIEETAYQIASLYYGWHFSTDPTTVLRNGTCVNTDD